MVEHLPNKYCKTTFLALPHPSYLNIQLSSSGQNNITTPEVTTNPKFAKTYQYLLL